MTLSGSNSNDHELKRASGAIQGLVLARDRTGRPLYDQYPMTPPHQDDLVFIQRDWSGGHGQYWLSKLDCYLEGQSIDTTQRGRLILGPEIQSTNVNTTYTNVAVTYAVASDGGVMTTETTAANNATANDMTLLPATPAKNDAYYLGYSATFCRAVINVGTTGSGTWTLVWEYYSGSAWTEIPGVNDGTGSFTGAGTGNKAITFAIPSDWAQVAVNSLTAYWIRARVSAYTSVTTQPKGTQAWISTTGTTENVTPIKFIWSNAYKRELMLTASSYYWYNNSVWVKDQGGMANIGGLTDIIEYNGVIYIATGASVKYYYTTDFETDTQSNLTDAYANTFMVAPNAIGNANVLWKSKNPNEVSNTTDGRTGGVQWSTAAYCGDTSRNIVNLSHMGGNVHAGREDGRIEYDPEEGTTALILDLKNNASTDNFKYQTEWQGLQYFSLPAAVMGELSPQGSLANMGPLYDIDDQGVTGAGKSGSIVGISSDKDWLYVAVDEGTNTHIYKGRETSQSGVLRWEWCPWVFLSTNACSTINVIQHSLTDRRLWFGYGNNAAYVPITDNPTADSAARFAASGWLRMSFLVGGNINWDKLVQYIVTQTKSCTANVTVRAYYIKDSETSATALTAAITSNGTVKTTLTAEKTCKRIIFELDLATNSNTATPEVLYFEARGQEKPTNIRIHECTYRLGDTESEQGTTVRDFLRNCATDTGLVKFADLNFGQTVQSGTNYVWVVMQGEPQISVIRHDAQQNPEMVAKVRWQEASFTIS